MRRFVLLILMSAIASVAVGAEVQASDVVREPSADTDESGARTNHIRAKIPIWLRDQGYRLRIDNELIDLPGESVTLHDSEEVYSFQLVDRDSRVLDAHDGIVEENLMFRLKPNHYRIGVHLGQTIVKGDKLRTILQDRYLGQQSLDFAWMPSALGVLASLVGVSSWEDLDAGLTSAYREAQARLGFVYEFVPLAHVRGYTSSIHLNLGGGALYSRSWLSIDDGVVEINDKSASYGGYLESALLFPVLDFWLDLRVFVSTNKLTFKTFELESQLIRTGMLLGGSYAF